MACYKKFLSLMIFMIFFICSTITFAEIGQTSTQGQISQTFQAWVRAVNTAKGDPAQILTMYKDTAILIPTFSDKILRTADERKKYFEKFTAYKNITVSPLLFLVQDFGELAIASGLYTFYYLDKNHHSKSIKARFSIVYQKNDGKWLIVNHHSSKLPKK